MAGLCEGGNEPPGSLKAIKATITISATMQLILRGGHNRFFKNNFKFTRTELALQHCERKDASPYLIMRILAYFYACTTNGFYYPSTDAVHKDKQKSLMLAGNEFQSLGRAIVKEDEYEEVRWDGIVSIVSWRERVFRLWWEERKNDAETDQEEEKELVGSLTEKKLPTEGCTGRNGEREKSSG
ncbi:hypothetical protein ANN_23034 [Periplaneta americana]|uniref:Uncharacterized protein n=1 Tax=Periplaneta americana TaxID=6978 RepID=A0ABQ8SK34_PERAM|nr:hypothetical protein ANN_23034 [Periplaneta americana]